MHTFLAISFYSIEYCPPPPRKAAAAAGEERAASAQSSPNGPHPERTPGAKKGRQKREENQR